MLVAYLDQLAVATSSYELILLVIHTLLYKRNLSQSFFSLFSKPLFFVSLNFSFFVVLFLNHNCRRLFVQKLFFHFFDLYHGMFTVSTTLLAFDILFINGKTL